MTEYFWWRWIGLQGEAAVCPHDLIVVHSYEKLALDPAGFARYRRATSQLRIAACTLHGAVRGYGVWMDTPLAIPDSIQACPRCVRAWLWAKERGLSDEEAVAAVVVEWVEAHGDTR